MDDNYNRRPQKDRTDYLTLQLNVEYKSGANKAWGEHFVWFSWSKDNREELADECGDFDKRVEKRGIWVIYKCKRQRWETLRGVQSEVRMQMMMKMNLFGRNKDLIINYLRKLTLTTIMNDYQGSFCCICNPNTPEVEEIIDNLLFSFRQMLLHPNARTF